MRTTSIAGHRPVAGFTMLEVLISIVVIAFGLLGIAGLQAFALKNNQNASFRTVATVLANDMIDRMKANPLGSNNGNYNAPGAGAYAAPVPACLAGTCTPAELATNDLYEWKTLLASSLPNGKGIVCLDEVSPDDGASAAAPACDGGSRYTVKIWWVDDRTKSALPGFYYSQFEQ